ncbi:MAG: hypothetical protein HQ453_03205, partial [Actinobacteria bacterium]|nr:hypothetical protein [Actinomycetota bacterium]
KGFRGPHPIKAMLVVVIIVAIQIALPSEVTPGPAWLIILVELSGIPIVFISRTIGIVETKRFRHVMDVYFFSSSVRAPRTPSCSSSQPSTTLPAQA